MRVLLSTYGSRGDVEPMAALAVRLEALGVEARVSAPADPEFTDLMARAGVSFWPAFMPVRQWIAEKAKPGPADFPKIALEMISGQFGALQAAAEGCGAILATGLVPSAAAARCVAELRGIPYLSASFCPLFLPSHHHRPFAYPGHPVPPDVTDNRALWDMNIQVKNALFGGAINAHRASIGLETVDNVRDHVFTERPLLASDAALWPWQPTELCDAIQTGAWTLSDHRLLPAELAAFLRTGPLPVYVGFGSMAMQPAKDAARIAVEAIHAQGRRAVVQRGWADLDLEGKRDDCLVIGEVNQQALFRRVAAIVHHGGAGTTAAATHAGTPQVIVPQIVDQPYWADRIARLGIGAALDGTTANFESLSRALDIALSAETGVRARAVAAMARTDGAAIAAKLLLERLTE